MAYVNVAPTINHVHTAAATMKALLMQVRYVANHLQILGDKSAVMNATAGLAIGRSGMLTLSSDWRSSKHRQMNKTIGAHYNRLLKANQTRRCS
jgi:hypothetical protein